MTALALIPPDALALIERAKATAAQVRAIVGVQPLDTPEREAKAGQLLRAIETLHGECEAARAAAKAPHLSAGRSVDEAFKAGAQRDLERVAGLLRERLAQAATAREVARREALAAVAPAVAAGDHVKANEALALANDPVFQTPAGPGITERFGWEAVGFDLSKIPLEYLAVDVAKIRAYVADCVRTGAEPAIPGVTFERKATIVVRKFG